MRGAAGAGEEEGDGQGVPPTHFRTPKNEDAAPHARGGVQLDSRNQGFGVTTIVPGVGVVIVGAGVTTAGG
jgi:hypothetical protein